MSKLYYGFNYKAEKNTTTNDVGNGNFGIAGKLYSFDSLTDLENWVSKNSQKRERVTTKNLPHGWQTKDALKLEFVANGEENNGIPWFREVWA